MALKTVLEYSRGMPSRNARAAMAQTALTGVLVTTLSAWNTLERGTPLACAIARSTLNRQPHVGNGRHSHHAQCLENPREGNALSLRHHLQHAKQARDQHLSTGKL